MQEILRDVSKKNTFIDSHTVNLTSVTFQYPFKKKKKNQEESLFTYL